MSDKKESADGEDIYIHNTLSGEKERFVPIREGKVGMYCCGPTTYNYIHLGNGRPLVVFDTIRRYLVYRGYEVCFVSNFTDVDDKIIDRAATEGEGPKDLADRYIGEYYKDAGALGVLRADFHPQVSGHMPEIISFVDALVQKGMAYPVDGDVYYAVERFPSYGKLSKRSREDLLDGARVDVDQRKHDAADFALWKKAKPGEPSWDSPWGPGRPGWHIECSAMSHKYLGESFDIHGGGADLIFPHHENEIAQSEGRFGHTMANYWIHNGFITLNREKMSKSLGNFFLLREILEKFPGQVVRFYLLSVHYRSPLDFDDEKLAVAQKGLERLKNTVRTARAAVAAHDVGVGSAPDDDPAGAAAVTAGGEATGDTVAGDTAGGRSGGISGAAVAFLAEAERQKTLFEKAMNDDFNTALAIAALFDLARAMNTYAAGGDIDTQALQEAHDRLVRLAGVLGLDLTEGDTPEGEDAVLEQALGALLGTLREQDGGERTAADMMETLLSLRQACRKARDFAGADAIRDGLRALGIVVEDTALGARWHRESW